MKILRRRRIFHGFSLGPGTPLHSVCVCLCVLAHLCVHCMLQWAQEACGLECAHTHQGRVLKNKLIKGDRG